VISSWVFIFQLFRIDIHTRVMRYEDEWFDV